MMRFTITKKIAFAMVGVVFLSAGAMVWITGQNLQSGFIAYLNQSQLRDLEELRDKLAASYRERGNFEWLRGDPQALRELNGDRRPPPEADRPPPPQDGPPPFGRRPPPRNQRPPGPPDPYGFGPRLFIYDESGRPLIGPPDPPPAPMREILVDGRRVGTLYLMPLRQIANTADREFVRGQLREMLWIAVALAIFSALLAVWLARHLLRPVAALRTVTERIAQGRLDARMPVLGRDELAELARHVNLMAQSLEANEQQRRKMLADVSHELRTPLSVIRGEIEALLDGIRHADPKALASLHEEVLRLNKLIDDLHQLALADAGDLHYQFQRVDLGALLNGLVNRYRPRAEAAGLALSSTITPDAVQVVADPDRITQVIVNLLENSLRYTDRGGNITVSLTRSATEAELRIEDSVPGVPDGMHAHLFERLYRADQARSRERGGSGLGLSICKVLVEAHRGRIDASPSFLGGIKMTLRLPLMDNREH